MWGHYETTRFSYKVWESSTLEMYIICRFKGVFWAGPSPLMTKRNEKEQRFWLFMQHFGSKPKKYDCHRQEHVLRKGFFPHRQRSHFSVAMFLHPRESPTLWYSPYYHNRILRPQKKTTSIQPSQNRKKNCETTNNFNYYTVWTLSMENITIYYYYCSQIELSCPTFLSVGEVKTAEAFILVWLKGAGYK